MTVARATALEPTRRGARPVGRDAVSRSLGTHFSARPLSCNGMAGHVPANRYCLLDFERHGSVGILAGDRGSNTQLNRAGRDASAPGVELWNKLWKGLAALEA